MGMRLKSPASRLFTQPFIQAQIKENIKAPRPWPMCGEFTVTGEFPAEMASNAENVSIWWRHHGDGRVTPCITGSASKIDLIILYNIPADRAQPGQVNTYSHAYLHHYVYIQDVLITRE